MDEDAVKEALCELYKAAEDLYRARYPGFNLGDMPRDWEMLRRALFEKARPVVCELERVQEALVVTEA